ncbi:MAG: hypothetical protein BMS9Abin08_0223 [Gammaproteobacteria bacterium]|nr:MAG: hypothetical protein BMS9Abin08_0223 [Gammaproteobacteria bacterium]
MRQKDAVPCSRILAAAALPILEHARNLQRLEQSVLQLLPENLSAHCKVQNLKSEILVLATTSPAWSARLRFAIPDLIKQLEYQLALTIRTIQVKIEPEAVEIQPLKRHQPKLSLASGTLLAQTANSVNHPALQEALYRLAAKARDF